MCILSDFLFCCHYFYNWGKQKLGKVLIKKYLCIALLTVAIWDEFLIFVLNAAAECISPAFNSSLINSKPCNEKCGLEKEYGQYSNSSINTERLQSWQYLNIQKSLSFNFMTSSLIFLYLVESKKIIKISMIDYRRTHKSNELFGN